MYTSEQESYVHRILNTDDPYQILEVDKNITSSQLRKKYHKLSLKVHPDKNWAPDSEEAFKKVTNAYEKILLDLSGENDYIHAQESTHDNTAYRDFFNQDKETNDFFRKREEDARMREEVKRRKKQEQDEFYARLQKEIFEESNRRNEFRNRNRNVQPIPPPFTVQSQSNPIFYQPASSSIFETVEEPVEELTGINIVTGEYEYEYNYGPPSSSNRDNDEYELPRKTTRYSLRIAEREAINDIADMLLDEIVNEIHEETIRNSLLKRKDRAPYRRGNRVDRNSIPLTEPTRKRSKRVDYVNDIFDYEDEEEISIV